MLISHATKGYTQNPSSKSSAVPELENFQAYKLDLEEPEIKLPTITGSWKKQGNSRKTSASLTTLKPLTVWITTNCGKFFRSWEFQTTLPVS